MQSHAVKNTARERGHAVYGRKSKQSSGPRCCCRPVELCRYIFRSGSLRWRQRLHHMYHIDQIIMLGMRFEIRTDERFLRDSSALSLLLPGKVPVAEA